MSFFTRSNVEMPSRETALPGRDQAVTPNRCHFVNSHTIMPPFPADCEQIVVGMGCFWGTEKKFWTMPGVYSTAVGYAQGYTPNPHYEEVCSGMTGHNEVALVVYEPDQIDLNKLLTVFWENHDPTQGMRQGNDTGTQYRSAIYTTTSNQLKSALKSRVSYQKMLTEAGYEAITTEIEHLRCFYYAEDYHQQYLAKNPAGYCGLGGTGIKHD